MKTESVMKETFLKTSVRGMECSTGRRMGGATRDSSSRDNSMARAGHSMKMMAKYSMKNGNLARRSDK